MSEQIQELSPDDLLQRIEQTQFKFESTEELDQLDEVIGQERAVRAVEFGIDIESDGYNIYALGPTGIGKTDTVREFLERKADNQPVPDDWIYVNNFDDEDCPNAISLPPGLGCQFKKDMDRLIEQLKTDVPQSFDSEDYQQERQQIQESFSNQRQQLMEELEQKAQEKDFTILQTPQGIMLAPVVQGQPLSPDKFSELSEDVREEMETKREELQDELRQTMNEIRELQQETREQIRDLDRRIINFAVKGLIDEIKEKYDDYQELIDHLDAVLEDILQNVQAFKQLNNNNDRSNSWPFRQGQNTPNFDKYRVNLMTDHSDDDGAPVVIERNPTYYNLLGRIEHKGEFGALTTNFTMIKEGALHRANDGYLMVEIKDILTKPFAWEALKRALKDHQIKTESMGQEYRAIQTQSLEPETIPLDVKLVLLGDPLIYYLLYNLDEDFQKLFKVKADFNVMTDRDDNIHSKYARFISKLCEEENLSHFDPSGVSRIIEEATRMVDNKEKISTRFGDISDLVRESCYWSRQNGNGLVTRKDVQEAVDEMIFRSNKIEERVRELIENETILIDTDDSVVGQVNGISVLPLGDYQFGKPTRITARTHAGNQGVVNIEREIELGGRIHNKGVMILSGYLGGQFAQDVPLALSASVTFEQTYEEVDGDSASSTELYALLSSLSDIPLKQNIAVTGSVNQRGEVQAIGGVNDKIQGFFKVCQLEGLTGDQGVLIPQSNVQHLMLRDEVIEAVENDQFHIYPVRHVDEGIEVLTDVPAGKRKDDGSFPEGTVKHAVSERLRELANTVKEFGSNDNKGTNNA